MATPPWSADDDVVALIEQVKLKHHHPRLEMASIAACFVESKPFTADGRFNWGRVRKFAPLDKLWHHRDRTYDFLLVICSDAWHAVLKELHQKEAYLDLLITRCTADYMPATVVVNGKEKKIQDEWGRLEFTDQLKCDEAGNPCWKVAPMDMLVMGANAKRYGLWHEDLVYVRDAVNNAPEGHEPPDPAPAPPANLFDRANIIPNADYAFSVNEAPVEADAGTLS